MDIYRCPRCAEPLAAAVTPSGLGYLPFSHSTVERQVADRLRDHQRICAVLREAGPADAEAIGPTETPPLPDN